MQHVFLASLVISPLLVFRGVSLVLDVGVFDITTCEALPDAFVELWAGE